MTMDSFYQELRRAKGRGVLMGVLATGSTYDERWLAALSGAKDEPTSECKAAFREGFLLGYFNHKDPREVACDNQALVYEYRRAYTRWAYLDAADALDELVDADGIHRAQSRACELLAKAARAAADLMGKE